MWQLIPLAVLFPGDSPIYLSPLFLGLWSRAMFWLQISASPTAGLGLDLNHPACKLGAQPSSWEWDRPPLELLVAFRIPAGRLGHIYQVAGLVLASGPPDSGFFQTMACTLTR